MLPTVITNGQARADLLYSRGELSTDERDTIALLIYEYRFLHRLLDSPDWRTIFVITKTELIDIFITNSVIPYVGERVFCVLFEHFPLYLRKHPSLKECRTMIHRLIVILKKVFPASFLTIPRLCSCEMELNLVEGQDINILELSSDRMSPLTVDEGQYLFRTFSTMYETRPRQPNTRFSDYVLLGEVNDRVYINEGVPEALQTVYEDGKCESITRGLRHVLDVEPYPPAGGSNDEVDDYDIDFD